MNTKFKGLRPWERRLVEARSWDVVWKTAVCGAALLCLAGGCGRSETADGSGLKDEVAKLRQEVSQLKGEVDRQKDAIRELRRRPEMAGWKTYRGRDMLPPQAGTNGLSRAGMPSRAELEARRKMMQDPEMRKKFEAEHKARMEERRRQHEERRRQMEERRRAHPAPKDAVPAAAPAVAPTK